jgi:signal transduction histidine kinase/ActR/RegA family two-component response regulator
VNAGSAEIERRALVLAPAGRDAAVAVALMAEAGLTSLACRDISDLAAVIREGCAVVLVTEEALRTTDLRPLVAVIADQPAWSDLPFVVFASQNQSDRIVAATRYTGLLGNVTFLERPFHPTTLLSMVQSALRTRDRQYQARAHLEERTRREAALHETQAELLQHRAELESLVSARTAALERANARLRQEMLERNRAETALRQSQKMEAVGQLTGGIAHDFNNLLSAILGGLELIMRRTADEQVRRLAVAAVDATRRGAKLTAQLLAFSRTQQLDLAPVDLNALVTGMQDLLSHSIGAVIELHCVPAREPVWAVADANQLELALLNLAINARDAMPEGGHLAVSVSITQPDGRRMASLAVADTGTGMSPDVVDRAFEPFFTTKDVGKGTGLGLAQVYGIANQSGGSATIESEPGRGTTVRLMLPLLEQAPGEVASRAGPEHSAAVPLGRSSDIILVVDDDPAVRGALVEMLRTLGYRVLEAPHGRAGLDLLLAQPCPHVMIVDYVMPGMSGAEVALAARFHHPTLPILFSTGYADTNALQGELAAMPVLRKPFRLADLATSVATALGHSRRDRAPADMD